MPTNIDTGLTAQDAVHADVSPHIFMMSNGDLVVVYFDGTNLVYNAKTGGAWQTKQTIAPAVAGNAALVRQTIARNGNVIFAMCSAEPIGSKQLEQQALTYNTGTHLFAVTSAASNPSGDANSEAFGCCFNGASPARYWAQIGGATLGLFAYFQCDTSFAGLGDAVAGDTPTTWPSSAQTGIVTDGSTTMVLGWHAHATSTNFYVDRLTNGATTHTSEAPPSSAANLKGVVSVWDGTQFVWIANENNAKLRYLTRGSGTGGTYGSWTDILSDASLSGEPAVCVKANGDLQVFYRTNKNQANGEIWTICRNSGTWGSAALLAGGAATGWSNPSCAEDDTNDAGNARVVYVTGTGSPWTLVEDVGTFTTGPPPQKVLPASDIDTTGWSTAPLYSKINDASNATVITSTI